MPNSIAVEIARLHEASLNELRQKYQELYGAKPKGLAKKEHLFRKIAFKLQEDHFGGLSEKAKSMLGDELQSLNPHQFKKQKQPKDKPKPSRDKRIPMIGTTLSRRYKQQEINVKVLANGFEYEQQIFPTLSALAKQITGTHVNGYAFFSL